LKSPSWAGGLEENATEAVVHEAFIPFGDIKGNATPLDQPTLKHHVFASITCFKKEDAAAAVEKHA
jgi:peptidyl-prolyl isomerase E (cyclophilin E)